MTLIKEAIDYVETIGVTAIKSIELESDPILHDHHRAVSLWLGIGIFLFPIIFAWFTLRKTHGLLFYI